MGDSQMVPMEYCHKTFSNGQCQTRDKCSLRISIDNDNNDNVNTVNFNVVEPPWSNEPKSALQPHLKLVTAASYVHAFWEVNLSMEHRYGRIRRWWGHGPRKNKLHFFRKDGFISIGFGNINAILIFCLIWYWVFSWKNLLLANCFQVDKTVCFWWMKLKGFHFTLKLW